MGTGNINMTMGGNFDSNILNMGGNVASEWRMNSKTGTMADY